MTNILEVFNIVKQYPPQKAISRLLPADFCGNLDDFMPQTGHFPLHEAKQLWWSMWIR